jgi:hypothetical protein
MYYPRPVHLRLKNLVTGFQLIYVLSISSPVTKIEAIKKECENETAIYTHVYVAKPPQQQTSIYSFYSKQKGEPKFSFSKHLKIFYRKMLFPGK